MKKFCNMIFGTALVVTAAAGGFFTGIGWTTVNLVNQGAIDGKTVVGEKLIKLVRAFGAGPEPDEDSHGLLS